MDKQGEFEQVPYKKLHELISQVSSDKLLVVSKTEAEVYELVHLGAQGIHTIKAGNTEYAIRASRTTPILKATYSTSIDSFRPKTHKGHWGGIPAGEEYAAEAAAMLIEGEIDIDQRIECAACNGQLGSREVVCSCTYGGVVFLDEESSEETLLREKGIPDPQCETCGGVGTYASICSTCSGTGSGYLYPTLTFVNRDTGQTKTEVINVAELIALGRLPVLNAGNALIAKFSELHKTMAKEVGVAPARMVGENQYGIYELDDPRTEIYMYPNLMERTTRKKKPKGEANLPRKVIDEIQRNTARMYMHPWESVRDEAGVIRGRSLQIFERPDIRQVLRTLIEKVEANGWKLGYKRGFIETGVDGPSFIILDKDMKMVGELSAEDSIETAVLNAYRAAEENL